MNAAHRVFIVLSSLGLLVVLGGGVRAADGIDDSGYTTDTSVSCENLSELIKRGCSTREFLDKVNEMSRAEGVFHIPMTAEDLLLAVRFRSIEFVKTFVEVANRAAPNGQLVVACDNILHVALGSKRSSARDIFNFLCEQAWHYYDFNNPFRDKAKEEHASWLKKQADNCLLGAIKKDVLAVEHVLKSFAMFFPDGELVVMCDRVLRAACKNERGFARAIFNSLREQARCYYYANNRFKDEAEKEYVAWFKKQGFKEKKVSKSVVLPQKDALCSSAGVASMLPVFLPRKEWERVAA